MKMKGRKAVAFWTTLAALLLIYFSTLKYAPAVAPAIGPTVVIMIVGNAATYIGGVEFDKWQRSKFFRSELDKS